MRAARSISSWAFAATVALSACTRSSAPSADAEPQPGSLPSTEPGATPTASVSGATRAGAPAAGARSLPEISGGGQRAERGEGGMVVSVEPNATLAGVRMLEQGGNAVDAAVAVAFALAVTHPSAGNIGGGGFMLVRPAGGPTVAIDFRERAPLSITQESFDRMIDNDAKGPAAVGVPGSVAGLHLAHSRFGRLPFADVVTPAIELAKEGHRLGRRQALTIQWAWRDLRRDPAARRIFGRANKPLRRGSKLEQPDLGRTLERIAKEGPPGFYAGPTADALVAAMGQKGHITKRDLATYRAVVREPLKRGYRGLTVEVMPPPSAGGVAILQMLGMLEALEVYALDQGSAEALHLFIEVARRAHATRRFDVVDPASVPGYDSKARRRAWFDIATLLDKAPQIDPVRATPSAEVHPLFDAAMNELEHTTHLSTVDGDGMVVSCTTTLSAGFGARFIAKGTGVILNNAIAAFGTVGDDLVKPGRRMTSSMAPTLVLRAGRPVLVLGSPGGDTIPNTIVQVLRNAIDYRMTIDSAVEAPRIHHGFVPDEIRYEKKRPPSRQALEKLQAMGHRLSDKRIPIGDANNISIVDGVAWGFADPREGGLAKGPAELGTGKRPR